MLLRYFCGAIFLINQTKHLYMLYFTTILNITKDLEILFSFEFKRRSHLKKYTFMLQKKCSLNLSHFSFNSSGFLIYKFPFFIYMKK